VPPAAEIKLLRLMQQETADLTRAAAEDTKPDPAAVDEVTRLQRELAEQGRALLERLSRQGPQPTGDVTDSDKPKNDQPKKPDENKPDEPAPKEPAPPKP
jgi:hypothetical protein